MSDNKTQSLQYFVIIAEQKKKNKFLTLLSEHGAKAVETVYGQGSMSPSAIAAAFGFEAKQGKVLISCLVKKENAEKLLDILYRDYNFSKPNTGIAFGISVEGLGF
ncbi:MAG: hypothetical protein E7653_04970 [Ruminococcaceae bacterium]|nr:hypothetical protein [Oscillospiraceae bacterium]